MIGVLKLLTIVLTFAGPVLLNALVRYMGHVGGAGQHVGGQQGVFLGGVHGIGGVLHTSTHGLATHNSTENGFLHPLGVFAPGFTPTMGWWQSFITRTTPITTMSTPPTTTMVLGGVSVSGVSVHVGGGMGWPWKKGSITQGVVCVVALVATMIAKVCGVVLYVCGVVPCVGVVVLCVGLVVLGVCGWYNGWGVVLIHHAYSSLQ